MADQIARFLPALVADPELSVPDGDDVSSVVARDFINEDNILGRECLDAILHFWRHKHRRTRFSSLRDYLDFRQINVGGR